MHQHARASLSCHPSTFVILMANHCHPDASEASGGPALTKTKEETVAAEFAEHTERRGTLSGKHGLTLSASPNLLSLQVD
jgi:hypothetical protein